MKNLNIRANLILLIFIVLIPVIVLYTMRIEAIHKDNIERELESNRRLVEAISTSFMNYIEEIWTQETTLSIILTKKPELSQNEIQYYLEETLKNQNISDVYTWVSPNGIVIGSTREDLIGRSLANREYFQSILHGEDKVVSDMVIGYSSKKPVIPIAKSIRKDGNLVGVMVAIIDVDKLRLRLPNSAVIKDSRFGIVDSNGNKVYQSDVPDITKSDMKISKDSPIWLALKGEAVERKSQISEFDKTKRVGVYIPIEEIGWACFVSSPYQIVMEKYEQQLRNDIVILIVVILVSLIAAFYQSSHILKRLYKLKEAANMMIDGNYSARANITGCDEIAATAQAFDRMAEGIENYDKLKTQFFINLSHELKTPINVIFASVQLISQVKADTGKEYLDRLNRHIRMVKQNCYRLIRLVNNLIDITRYDSGFLNIKPNIYNIVEIIENITMSIVKYAEIKEIKILFHTEIKEKFIVCDPDMIERIMLNLFSNSLKFTNQKGSIMVKIYDKDESVFISVKDTGIGIPKDKLDMVFERFRQVDASLNRNHEGSGIGLSLIKALVEAHQGTISAESTVGEGTEFIIQLPAKASLGMEYSSDNAYNNPQSMIDRINIEFSDIYSFSDIEKI